MTKPILAAAALAAIPPAVQTAGGASNYIVRAGVNWTPVEERRDIIAGSALDFSYMGFQDAPSGKHGWLKARGDHFEFEDRPGDPIRFCGGNICQTACFPDHELADSLAVRFRRLGWNAIRIHHHDGAWAGENIDRLDYFIAKCIENGLYITTDLYVSRQVAWREIGIDREGTVPGAVFKALCAVYEPAFENWAQFARAFLGHVNPYTGRRYADEPAMPLLSMVNEGIWYQGWREVRSDPRVMASWREWLTARRADNPSLCPDADADAPPENFWDDRTSAIVAWWIGDLEAQMFDKMRAAVRATGCRALLTNYNCGPHFTAVQRASAEYDYIDDHFYVDHPKFPERPWAVPSECHNRNFVLEGEPMPPSEQAFACMATKPFTVSEWNFCGPGRFRAAGGLLTGAMAALQGWGGIWRFAYSHHVEHVADTASRRPGFLDLASDPLALASERAAICLFLRGDMEPLPRERGLALWATRESVRKQGKALSAAPPWRDCAWATRVATCQSPSEAAGSAVLRREEAETEEPPFPAVVAHDDKTPFGNALKLDRERGAFTVVTPRTCGGFAESGTIEAGPLTASLSSASPAAIWASSLDGKPLAESQRILVTHITDVQGDGAVFDDETFSIMRKWGARPLMRNGVAEVELKNTNKSFLVFALSPAGERRRQVPASWDPATETLRFVANVAADPNNATFLYEIALMNE